MENWRQFCTVKRVVGAITRGGTLSQFTFYCKLVCMMCIPLPHVLSLEKLESAGINSAAVR